MASFLRAPIGWVRVTHHVLRASGNTATRQRNKKVSRSYRGQSCQTFSSLFLYIHYNTNHLREHTLGQRGHLLLEQILGLLPHAGVLAVLQLQKAGHQGLAEHLGALPGEERGQMVNADDAERGTLGARGQDDRHGGLVEGGRDGVDGDGVVGVGTTWV